MPILGICYGMQLACQMLGADVRGAPAREYGRAALKVLVEDPLLRGVPRETSVWMSHGDQVRTLNDDFVPLAETPTCPVAAVRHKSRPVYGVQFHPEVAHTPHGNEIFVNFLYDICRCQGLWKMDSFIEAVVADVRAKVGPDERVICGLSGGVDSSVVAALLHRAIGERLACILVDNGLLRAGEAEAVHTTFGEHFGIDLTVVPAAEKFLAGLAGVTDPQEKRRIIGREFIEAFRSAAKSIPAPAGSPRGRYTPT